MLLAGVPASGEDGAGVGAEALEAVETAPFLSETQKRDISYNNAARFLRLTEAEIAADRAD